MAVRAYLVDLELGVTASVGFGIAGFPCDFARCGCSGCDLKGGSVDYDFVKLLGPV